MENALTLLPIINIVGFIMLAISLGVSRWKQGANTVGEEVLELYKKQIDALKEDAVEANKKHHETRNKLTDLSLRIGHLEGQLAEKDKKIDEYLKIFQNRDPALVEILIELRNYLKFITTQTTANEVRNKQIDASTAAEQGKILRKKI